MSAHSYEHHPLRENCAHFWLPRRTLTTKHWCFWVFQFGLIFTGILRFIVLCRFFTSWRFVGTLCCQIMVSIFSNIFKLRPFFKKKKLFIYFWLCWVFVPVRGLSLVVASGGHSSSRCAGLSPSRPLSLRSTGSRRAGSVVVAHRPSRSAACGIFPDQGLNPHRPHWQADSQSLRHQGSP